ncbi:MAG: cation transporter [Clostridia bacterium]|nr:cation transporter [Clostridia bacterium]
MEKRKTNTVKIAITVSIVTIIINVFLFVGKLLAGIFAHSSAMVSDAVHSASDVFSTVVVLIGIKVASKDSDKGHPYGHERFECVVAILLAVLLAGVGITLGVFGVQDMVSGNYQINVPELPALITAIISIIIKEGMYWYTRYGAKKINSDALMADAWHHRSDALSSIGAFVGILGAMLGAPILDSIASLVICLLILKVAVDIFRGAVGKMVDKSCDETTVQKMSEVIKSVDGVRCLDEIKTRVFGNKIYVEIEVAVDGQLRLIEAHEIAETVHDEIELQFPDVKHCMVHVNPD